MVWSEGWLMGIFQSEATRSRGNGFRRGEVAGGVVGVATPIHIATSFRRGRSGKFRNTA